MILIECLFSVANTLGPLFAPAIDILYQRGVILIAEYIKCIKEGDKTHEY